MSTSLAQRFEEHRGHLVSVAHRMLGSREDAEDAVQEAWVRLNGSDASGIANLRGWLTTVVARICLDVLRSRATRREDELEEVDAPAEDTEASLFLAESVGIALTVVLDTLAPAERVAFVLHDMFDIPFDDVARVLGKSSDAARQLASRARRRVRGAAAGDERDRSQRKTLVQAFLEASRSGNLAALLELLDPAVVLTADDAAVLMGAAREVRGASAVADTFKGRAVAARFALIDGWAGLVWGPPDGPPRVVFTFAVEDGRITGVELIAGRDRIEQFHLA